MIRDTPGAPAPASRTRRTSCHPRDETPFARKGRLVAERIDQRTLLSGRCGRQLPTPGVADGEPLANTTERRASGETRVSADLGQETSRRAKAGPAIRRAARDGSYTPQKKSGCFGPTVTTIGGSVDEAAGLAGGEERVVRRPVFSALLSGRHRASSGRTVAAGGLCGVGASVTMPAGRWGRSGAGPGGAVGSRWLRTGLLRSCALASWSLVTYRAPLQRFVVGSLRGAAAPRPSGN